METEMPVLEDGKWEKWLLERGATRFYTDWKLGDLSFSRDGKHWRLHPFFGTKNEIYNLRFSSPEAALAYFLVLWEEDQRRVDVIVPAVDSKALSRARSYRKKVLKAQRKELGEEE